METIMEIGVNVMGSLFFAFLAFCFIVAICCLFDC